ncbi:MAG: hypothetical protein DMG21_05240 [Acidobacteria bacterium]|nr:MAG: hypothetical protein DMG21_05240 [Acidobacteriota bacterium]
MCSTFLKLSCLLLLALCPVQLSAAGLRAGVAHADITPQVPLPMYGYMDRPQRATGTLDPLEARVLVLEAGDEKLALITLDLGRDFGPASMAKLEEAIRRSTGIQHFFITASHTHSGPNILDEYPSGATPAWETEALDKIARAAAEANAHLENVRLGVGRGRVYIGYNRRVVHADGTVTMLWTNPGRQPTAPLDPTVTVLRLDRADGSPLAVLINYACHPVIFGADHLEYSSDFVGVMRKTVEDGFGGKPMAFFIQGADGDINPYDATTPMNQGAVVKRDGTGSALGREALRVAEHVRTEPATEPRLQVVEDNLQVPVRWDARKFREVLLQADEAHHGATQSTHRAGGRARRAFRELSNQFPRPLSRAVRHFCRVYERLLRLHSDDSSRDRRRLRRRRFQYLRRSRNGRAHGEFGPDSPLRDAGKADGHSRRPEEVGAGLVPALGRPQGSPLRGAGKADGHSRRSEEVAPGLVPALGRPQGSPLRGAG